MPSRFQMVRSQSMVLKSRTNPMAAYAMKFLLVICSCLISSCSDKTQDSDGEREAGASGTLPDLLLEFLDDERREPVLITDYEPLSRIADFDVRALNFYAEANLKKDEESFSEAARLYERTLQLEPKFSHAAYQQACNLELQGNHDEAWKWFDQAVTLGFFDFPFCCTDHEINQIRQHEGFAERMDLIRERYRKFVKSREATPVVFPAKVNTTNKAPIILLLHGYGDDHESYFDEAESWVERGFLAVAVPAPIPMAMGGFHWVESTLDVTQAQLQQIVRSEVVQSRGDTKRVFLLGFSQGAGHALQLCVKHPELYAGCVGIGLGGKLWLIRDPAKATLDPVSSAVLIYGEEEGTKSFTLNWQRLLQEAGWRVQVLSHPHGHQFPNDWEQLRTATANFLLAK